MAKQKKDDDLQNFRADAPTRKIIRTKAERHTNGNVSEWLRRAGTEYEPKRQASK